MSGVFHSRSEWAVRNPSFGDLHLPVPRVFAHHTAGPYMPSFDINSMRAAEESEIARGSYVALAYHELYMGDGDIAESRPLSKMGGATINNNSTSVAICLPGDYSLPGSVVSWAQASTAIDRLVAMVTYGIVTRNFELHPHSDVFSTACPGAFRDSLAGIRQSVAAKIAGGTPPPPPGPAPAPLPPGNADAFLAHLSQAVSETRMFLNMGAVVAPGSHNDSVWTVQIACNVAGAGLVVDSSFGAATLAAVKTYQSARHLSPDGIVGRKTYAMMYPS